MTVRTGGLTGRKAARRPEGAKRASAKAAPATTGSSGKGVNLALLLLAVWGSLHVLVMLGVEGSRFFESRREIVRLETDVAALKAERDGLQAVIAHAADASYREQLARCLGFIYPEETRYLTRVDTKEPIISRPICQ